MSQNEIYKILIDYIQEDNRWKAETTKTVTSIEAQTKLTNGRMDKIEPVVERLEELNITNEATKKLNWRWVLGILAIIEFFFTATFYLIIDWIKQRIN